MKKIVIIVSFGLLLAGCSSVKDSTEKSALFSESSATETSSTQLVDTTQELFEEPPAEFDQSIETAGKDDGLIKVMVNDDYLTGKWLSQSDPPAKESVFTKEELTTPVALAVNRIKLTELMVCYVDGRLFETLQSEALIEEDRDKPVMTTFTLDLSEHREAGSHVVQLVSFVKSGEDLAVEKVYRCGYEVAG